MPENTIHDPKIIALLKQVFEAACAALPPERDTQSTRAHLAECILQAAPTENAIRCGCVTKH
jgi:hypothetical protein